MTRFLCFAFALLAFVLISVQGASVGRRMKRETCAVMMIRTNNCSNHGYCVSDRIGPHCRCDDGWSGHLCQYRRQQESNPLTDDDRDDDDDDSTTTHPQTTEEAPRQHDVTTESLSEQTTADQGDDEVTTRGDRDGAVGGVVNEDDRLAILCDELYNQTNTCSNRQGHCSIDSIGAFCQCNTGFIGMTCQYSAETVAEVLEAISGMMRDPHYRVIGGAFS